MKCLKCETELENGLRFCPHCGAGLIDPAGEAGQPVKISGANRIVPRFLNNLEYIRLLCLLQAIDGGIDKGGILEEAQNLVKSNNLAEGIKAVTAPGKSVTVTPQKFLSAVQENTDLAEKFCALRFTVGDDRCDALMEMIYEYEHHECYNIRALFGSEIFSVSIFPLKTKAEQKVFHLYGYDILLGLLEYAMTNDLYSGGKKRFIRHLARKWRVEQDVYSALEDFAGALADIEKKRQKIMESSEPFKKVQQILTALEEAEQKTAGWYFEQKEYGFSLASSGGSGYGLKHFQIA